METNLSALMTRIQEIRNRMQEIQNMGTGTVASQSGTVSKSAPLNEDPPSGGQDFTVLLEQALEGLAAESGESSGGLVSFDKLPGITGLQQILLSNITRLETEE